jgi:hypothetical protein
VTRIGAEKRGEGDSSAGRGKNFFCSPPRPARLWDSHNVIVYNNVLDINMKQMRVSKHTWRECRSAVVSDCYTVKCSGTHARCDLDAPSGDIPNHTRFLQFEENDLEGRTEGLIEGESLIQRPVHIKTNQLL